MKLSEVIPGRKVRINNLQDIMFTDFHKFKSKSSICTINKITKGGQVEIKNDKGSFYTLNAVSITYLEE